MASDKILVFACSLAKSYERKIKDDVGSILSGECPVDGVYFFSSQNIPSGKRSSLVSWAQKDHKIELTIFDGYGISEQLADLDTYWIAQKWLSMPAELSPESPVADEDWYKEASGRWISDAKTPSAYADFVNIKSAARHALKAKGLEHHLPDWIKVYGRFLENRPPEPLVSLLNYEIIFLSRVGIGSLEGHEDRIHSYLSRISQLSDITDFGDALNVLNLCIGSVLEHRVQLTEEVIKGWLTEFKEALEKRLSDSQYPNTITSLLEIKGTLYLVPGMVDSQSDAVDRAIACWLSMLEMIPQSPLFPLDRFANRLSQYIPLIGGHPRYDDLVNAIDELLADRYGDFAAAEKSRDRALSFYQSGEELRALHCLHESKQRWLASESIGASLISMLLIAEWYQDIGLCFASKYYSLIVAYMALNSEDLEVKDFVPRGILSSALADYSQGSWISYLDDMDAALVVGSITSSEDMSDHLSDDLDRAMYPGVVLRILSPRILPEFEPVVIERTSRWGIDDVFERLASTGERFWGGLDADEIWTRLESEFAGRPLGDVGPVRTVNFEALGVHWTFTWENSYETNLKAEQFLAVFQIFIADVANDDLCILPTKVSVLFETGDAQEITINRGKTVGRNQWVIDLGEQPKDSIENQETIQGQLSAAISRLLFDTSLLVSDAFFDYVKERFKHGFWHKLIFIAPYYTIARSLTPPEVFHQSDRAVVATPDAKRGFSPRSADCFRWRDDPRSYDEDTRRTHLLNRYKRTVPPIQLTVERLKKHSSTMEVITKLRQTGWKDWHLLLAILNITVNYRTHAILGDNLTPENQKAMSRQLSQEPETENLPEVPIENYSESNLRHAISLSMIDTLHVYGLEIHQAIPDLFAVDRFLATRYLYWDDDVEHEDFFSPQGDS